MANPSSFGIYVESKNINDNRCIEVYFPGTFDFLKYGNDVKKGISLN